MIQPQIFKAHKISHLNVRIFEFNVPLWHLLIRPVPRCVTVCFITKIIIYKLSLTAMFIDWSGIFSPCCVVYALMLIFIVILRLNIISLITQCFQYVIHMVSYAYFSTYMYFWTFSRLICFVFDVAFVGPLGYWILVLLCYSIFWSQYYCNFYLIC
jgi:hypothetical protein